MEKDRRELLGRLFAIACDLIERAHETAVAGQSPQLDAKAAALCARSLATAARDLAALAETAGMVARGQDRDGGGDVS